MLLRDERGFNTMQNKIILISMLLSHLYAMDLQQAVDEVIRSNPDIQERVQNYNATHKDIQSAKSGYYPKIDLVLGAGKEKTDRDLYNTDYKVYENSLKYTQNIFNGFNTTYLVKEKEYKTVAAAYSYIEKVNSVSLDMVNAYLDLMENQELLGTAKENVAINQQILTKIKKLYKAGFTTLSEVKKIESSLALAQSNLIVQQNNILDATYNFEKVLGRSVDPTQLTKPTLTNVKFPKTVEDAIAFAKKNNPSLLISEYNIKLAQAANREKKSQFYPKVDIEVSQSFNHNSGGILEDENIFKAMAFVSYNLFNGFNDSAEVEKTLSQTYQEIENKNSLQRDIKKSLKLAWTAQEKLKEQLKYLLQYKKFSHKTLLLYAKEYSLGQRSLLDLLSAQNDFIRSKSQIITTQYSILTAQYKILNSMGILVPSIMHKRTKIYENVNLQKI